MSSEENRFESDDFTPIGCNASMECVKWATMKDSDGDTPLHLAVIREDIRLTTYFCNLLASQNISVDIKNNILQTPLHLACITGRNQIVRTILQSNVAEIDCQDRNGNTCLHLAVKYDNRYSDTLRMLLNHLAKSVANHREVVIAKNVHGYSALHVASSINKAEALKLLVAHGAEVDQPETRSGKSPLYIAVQEKHEEAARTLLELGADPNQNTYFRDSASQLASNHDRRSMLRLLSKYDTTSTISSTSDLQKVVKSFGGLENTLFMDTAFSTTTEMQRRNVIVTNNPQSNNQSTSVKSERLSPKPSSQTDFHKACHSISENTSKTERARQIRDNNFKEKVTTNKQPPYDDRQAGDQLLRSVFSPASVAAALFSRHMQQSGIHNAKSRYVLPLSEDVFHLTVPRTSTMSNNRIFSKKHLEDKSTLKCNKSVHTNATSPPAGKSSNNKASNSTSTRHGIYGEPLDLSQNKADSNQLSETDCQINDDHSGRVHTTMLVETETAAVCKGGAQKSNPSSPRESINDQLINIKTEPVDIHSDIAGSQQRNNAEQAIHPLISYHLPFQQFSAARNHTNIREAFVPVGASWPILHNAPVNANSFLPHAFGFIPAGLGHPRTPLEALASLDPNALAQRKHAVGLAAAGLSQWVNISLDVARVFEQLRQTPMSGVQTNYPPHRKRKVSVEREVKTTDSSQTQNETDAALGKKRIRLHGSLSDGVKRSVSDDQCGRMHMEKDESTGKKKTLERRNSAPSTNFVSQILKQEDQKRITPIDLHSYTGCLPPHYLHILESSGNLPSVRREHTLRDVNDVYDPARKYGLPSRLKRETATKTSGSSSPEDSESAIERTREMRTEKGATKTVKNFDRSKNLWRPGITTDNEERSSHAVISGSLNNHHYRSSATTERIRKTSEADSDDENFIQSLQISDASSDEEDEIIVNAARSLPFAKQQQHQRQSYAAKPSDAIEFGKGIWRDMDRGQLPAFSFRNGGEADVTYMTPTQHALMLSEAGLPPTKMASEVKSQVPQPLNGLSRVYSPTRFLRHRTGGQFSSYTNDTEYLPNHKVPYYERESKVLETRLKQTHSVGTNVEHRCGGCHEERPFRGEAGTHTRKLLASILRKSFPKNTKSSYINTVSKTPPRLVFSGDVQATQNQCFHGKQSSLSSHQANTEKERMMMTSSKLHSNSRSYAMTKKTSSESSSFKKRQTPATSTERYTHKLFNAVRPTKENDKQREESHGSEEQKAGQQHKTLDNSVFMTPLINGQTNQFRRTRHSSSSGSSPRRNSLDAKLEELRQRAMQNANEDSSTQANSVTNKDERGLSSTRDAAHTAIAHIKQEKTDTAEDMNVNKDSAVTTPNSHSCTMTETSHRPSNAFGEGESGRFGTRKNVAIIKPNQSSDHHRLRTELPDYVCPPKKRHLNRYSPDSYRRIKKERSPVNREVRSASPVTRAPPFVSTNFVVSTENLPRNVSWRSPERSSGRSHTLSPSRTILTYHVPGNLQLKSLRGSLNHTVTVENYRKTSRYVISPRADAVIVVNSRVNADGEDERLEIGDLEISDDEN